MYFIEYLVSSCRCALAVAFVGFPGLFLGVCEPRGIMYPVQHVSAIFQHPFFVCFFNDLAASNIRTVPAFKNNKSPLVYRYTSLTIS